MQTLQLQESYVRACSPQVINVTADSAKLTCDLMHDVINIANRQTLID